MNLELFKGGIKVGSNGTIKLTKKQWHEFCRYLHCISFSYERQLALISEWIHGAIEEGVKDLTKKVKKKKPN